MDKLIFLLNTSWQWGLIVGIVWLLVYQLRRAHTICYALWLTVLVTLPILLGLNAHLPGISFNRTQTVHTVSTPQSQPTDTSNRQSSISGQVITGDQLSPQGTNPSSKPQTKSSRITWQHIVFLAWVIGIAWSTFRLCHSAWRLRQLHRSAHPADAQQQQLLKNLCERLAVKRPVNLLISEEIGTPISFGWRRPCILLHQNVTNDRLEFILLHELAHLQRKDWLVNLLVHAIGIPFFFHPLFYLVRKRLADVREQICDGWVIQTTGQRADYAQCLVDMLDQSVHRTKLALALGHQRSQLKNRVKTILDNGFPLNLHLSRKVGVLIGGLALLLTPLLSMAQIMPQRTVSLPFAESEPAVRIRGRILSPDGKPLSDTNLEFSVHQVRDSDSRIGRRVENIQTDAKGNYELSVDQLGVYKFSVGYRDRDKMKYPRWTVQSEQIRAEKYAQIDRVDLTLIDRISALIESGKFSEEEVKMLKVRRFPWKFDKTGTEIRLPKNTVETFPANSDFESNLTGWTKWLAVDKMNSQRTCEVIYDEDKRSHVVEFKRTGGGSDGSHVGVHQDIYIDLSKYQALYLQLDIKSVEHSLEASGWSGGGENPVCIELGFLDQKGEPHRWIHGFYHKGQDRYDTSTKIQQNKWFTYTSPNLKEIIPLCGYEENVRDDWFGVALHRYDPDLEPKAITRILLRGSGWDFAGRADNLRFTTALNE